MERNEFHDIELELLLVEEEIIEHDTKQRRYDEEVRVEQERLNKARKELISRQYLLKDMKRFGIKHYRV